MCRETIWWISCVLTLGAAGYASAALPDGWSSRDIGTTGGSASEAGGTWTVSGDGADVWGSSDAFHFAYLPLSGNGPITARVVSHGSGSSTWSKGGVMIRETLAPGSKHAIMAITGGNGGGLAFQNRPTTGGRCYTAHGNPVAAPPYWVRLAREGDTITAYSSADGINWVQQPDGVDTYATSNPVQIPMAADVFVGLFVCSGVAGEVRTYTFDNVSVGCPVIALEPEPQDGAVHLDTWATLTWAPGSTADSHDVYFGESFTDVDNGTGETFRGNQRSTSFDVGLPGSPCPDGLIPGTTYYWRVDEVEADGVTKHRGTVWSFLIPSSKACNPVPGDGAEFVAAGVTLTWTAGLGAELHTVYLGDDPDAVANAAGGIPQMHTQYYPGALEFDKTYYWRVDEFVGTVTQKGDVWSFTTMPADALQRPSAVSTFHCMGVYWSPHDGSSDNVCQVRYRRVGSAEWKEALPLWYDDRELGVDGGSNIVYPPQYRGSIVNLEPGTAYEIELRLLNTGTTEIFTAATWSGDFPIAKTVYLPAGTTNQTLRVTESGSPDGYILYTASDGGSVIDVDHNRDYCVTVDASYVIIRGLNLKGARRYGIRLYDCHDVVIEQCDISDFGSIEDDGWGNYDSAIFSHSVRLKRIIVQRNKMHHPYADTNSWSEYRAKYGSSHPRGPGAIGFARSAGNHVVRYNEIYSDNDHYFGDCMGSGNDNFPNRDSDIYGNYIANCWDDGIEAEDDNCNVRIWGNFIEWTFVMIAVAPTNVGPVYVWRNVAGVARGDDIQSWNEVSRGGFLKTDNGGGKTYVFHNTLLQPEPPRGVYYPLGCGRGLGWGGRMLNTMSRNNILHVHRPGAPCIKDCTGVTYHDPLGDYDYDLYNGYIDAYPGAEPNGIHDVPIYDPNNGDGEFALDSSSPGYDAGVVIPNFNDNYDGAAPDIGAYEAGSPPMEFGVNAYQ